MDRPVRFKDILGQDSIIQRLKISIGSALERNEPLGHCLFSGPSGMGKTTLAGAVANELNQPLIKCNGPGLRGVKSLEPYLDELKFGSVWFIDEIHRVSVPVMEALYTVMEDFQYQILRGEKKVTEIPRFTLVVGTTDAGMLTEPFQNRFTYRFRLQPYSVDNLKKVIQRGCLKLNVFLTDHGSTALAKASRSTPRVALSHLEWLRDVYGDKVMDADDVVGALAAIGVSKQGLNEDDRSYLKVLKRHGKPVGLKTIVKETMLAESTIVESVEPFLFQNGWVTQTPKGRLLCAQA